MQVTRRSDFQRQIDEHLASEDYDVVQVEFANMASYRYSRRGRRPTLVLDEHNIEYDLQRRTAGSAEGTFRKVYNSLNWRKLGREEKAAWRRFDGVVLTSVRDAQLLAEVSPGTSAAVVPNGVNVEQFQPAPLAPAPDQPAVFRGQQLFSEP